MTDQVTITIPSKSEYVSLVRMTAAMIANQVAFDVEAVEDVKIAISEACNNVIQHSNCMDNQFVITFAIESGQLSIEVVDEGRGFDVDSSIAPDLDNPKESGLGIFIMQSLMDEVNITSLPNAGTAVKLIKRMH